MSVLPDHEIEQFSLLGLINPYKRAQLQPASYDVLLAGTILVPCHSSRHPMAPRETIDLRDKDQSDKFHKFVMGTYRIDPGEFILAATDEFVTIPDCIVGRIEGKSSLARVGLQIHSAGYLDPGFRGNVTLELVNFHPSSPIILRSGMAIAQLSFDTMTSACRRPYGSPGLGSHYQDASGPDYSRYGE